MIRILIFFMVMAALISCSKQDVARYERPNALSFYHNTDEADSLSYSFATIGYGKQTDTVYLKMRVVGTVENKDRPMKLRAVGGSAARADIDYKLPEFAVPAGASTFLYPLVVYKTPEMSTQTLRLVLEVAPNEAFPEVAPEGLVAGLTTADNTISHNQLKIDFTNKLIKPGSWPSRFGTYSDVKYAFVIKTLGTGDFRLTTQGGQWTNIDLDLARVALREALIQYEIANGPLLDEMGVRVTF